MSDVEHDAASLFVGRPEFAGLDLEPTPADDYRAIVQRGHSLIAHADERLIGFVAAVPQGRDLFIKEISVARASQQRGIATVLLQALGIDARNSGFDALTLDTFADVPWNGPFYARHGFAELLDLSDRPYLADKLRDSVTRGIPAGTRCAMARILN